MKKYLFFLAAFCFLCLGCQKSEDKQPAESKPAQQQQVSAKDEIGDDPYALHQRGKKKLESNDFTGAIEDMTKSLKLQENNFVRGDLGRAKESDGDFEGALAQYTKAIEQNKRGVYYEWRSRTYLKLGKKDEAKKDMEEAAKLPKE